MERGKVLGLFPHTTWPSRDLSAEEDVRGRLHATLIVGLTPSESTVALIGLLQATGLLTRAIPTEDKKTLRSRAKQLTQGDWAAQAVKQAIEEVQAATAAIAGGAAAAGSS
jgi:hypothetical protein